MGKNDHTEGEKQAGEGSEKKTQVDLSSLGHRNRKESGRESSY
jgi:hypothetical protein